MVEMAAESCSACSLQDFSDHAPPESAACNTEIRTEIMSALGESVSFGRYLSESLDWGKWSSFSHNKYLEDAERYSRPGSVAQKKAYFEAHYKRIAALKAAEALEDAGSDVADHSPDNTTNHSSCISGSQVESSCTTAESVEQMQDPVDDNPYNYAEAGHDLEEDEEVMKEISLSFEDDPCNYDEKNPELEEEEEVMQEIILCAGTDNSIGFKPAFPVEPIDVDNTAEQCELERAVMQETRPVVETDSSTAFKYSLPVEHAGAVNTVEKKPLKESSIANQAAHDATDTMRRSPSAVVLQKPSIMSSSPSPTKRLSSASKENNSATPTSSGKRRTLSENFSSEKRPNPRSLRMSLNLSHCQIGPATPSGAESLSISTQTDSEASKSLEKAQEQVGLFRTPTEASSEEGPQVALGTLQSEARSTPSKLTPPGTELHLSTFENSKVSNVKGNDEGSAASSSSLRSMISSSSLSSIINGEKENEGKIGKGGDGREPRQRFSFRVWPLWSGFDRTVRQSKDASNKISSASTDSDQYHPPPKSTTDADLRRKGSLRRKLFCCFVV